MIKLWKLRALLGPMRPFLLRNVADRLRELRRVRTLSTLFAQEVPSDVTLARDIVPLPTSAWMNAHGSRVIQFATNMAGGFAGAFGIHEWTSQALPEDVDIRSVHELSRMHQWCAYAVAAHLKPDQAQQWFEVLEQEISSFVERWPPERGVHWAFPMGTGIRVYSMLVAADWARRAGWSNPALEQVILRSAVDHARSVFARLERRGGLSTSHYAANLLGLLAAARYLPAHPDAKAWEEVASIDIPWEISRQILADGMANEGSTGYHRQVVDTFVQASQLLKLPEESKSRLAMAVASLRTLEDLGMPLIGDNDDGLSVKLTGLKPDTSYLYCVAERTLSVPDVQGMSWPVFGLEVVKEGAFTVGLRNGPVGQFGKGGHAHNDMNSVYVWLHATPLVIDTGCSTYTRYPARRNTERSVHAHSTMWTVGDEPRSLVSDSEGLFWLLESGSGSLRKHETSLIGEYASRGRTHRREIDVTAKEVRCADVFTGARADASVVTTFILAPNVDVHLHENSAVLVCGDLAVTMLWTSARAECEDVEIATAFGATEETKCLRLYAHSLEWRLQL